MTKASLKDGTAIEPLANQAWWGHYNGNEQLNYAGHWSVATYDAATLIRASQARIAGKLSDGTVSVGKHLR